MATGAWSTSANKEAPSANSHERRLPIRRRPGVLVGEGRVALVTAPSDSFGMSAIGRNRT
jgi:hypothetical protein